MAQQASPQRLPKPAQEKNPVIRLPAPDEKQQTDALIQNLVPAFSSADTHVIGVTPEPSNVPLQGGEVQVPQRLPSTKSDVKTERLPPAGAAAPTEETLPLNPNSTYQEHPSSPPVPAVRSLRNPAVRSLQSPAVSQQPLPPRIEHPRPATIPQVQAPMPGQQHAIDALVPAHAHLPTQVQRMWWADTVKGPIGIGQRTLPISIDVLVRQALQHSLRIQSLMTEPEIRRATVQVESAAFDWTSFVESRFDDTSDPIGSTLTTGNIADERFVDQTWAGSVGVRRRNRLGGEAELAQNGGTQRNNSQFLIPNPQGTTRLEFNYTQPLFNNAGTFVNESRIVLAKLDLQATDHRTKARIQDHLIEVTDAYWDLYRARSQLLQKRKLLKSAQMIHQTLLAREGVDVLRRQILRAEVAVTSREAEVIRAQTEIRNAQAALRNLTNDPNLIASMGCEWTPQDEPLGHRIDVSTEASAQIALAKRPEINEGMRRVKALSVQAKVARRDLLPRIDLIMRTYIAGLADTADTLGAWENQWTNGRPTYGVGLLYEFPIGNRAANGNLRRSRWELTREMRNFESSVEQTLLDVDVAVREIHTAYREMVSKQGSVMAAAAEVQYLDERWRTLPTPQDSAVLLLENLLDAQQRLGVEESAFTSAQVSYARSWTSLRRAMGTLLQVNPEPILNSAPLPMHTGQAATRILRPQLVGGSAVVSARQLPIRLPPTPKPVRLPTARYVSESQRPSASSDQEDRESNKSDVAVPKSAFPDELSFGESVLLSPPDNSGSRELRQ